MDPIRKITGTCEVTTGVFEPTSQAPIYQAENGATLLEVSMTRNGAPFNIPADAQARYYVNFDARKKMTPQTDMMISGSMASAVIGSDHTLLPGAPDIVVLLADEASNLHVTCKFPVRIIETLSSTVFYQDPVPSWRRNPYINPDNHNWMVWDSSKNQFVDTGVQAEGKSPQFNVTGLYPTLDALIAAHPIGVYGDAYLVGTPPDATVYGWDVGRNAWVEYGPLQGPPGEDGPAGEDGAQGEPGPAGMSAYESAKAGGYPDSKTEAEFYADVAEVSSKATVSRDIPISSGDVIQGWTNGTITSAGFKAYKLMQQPDEQPPDGNVATWNGWQLEDSGKQLTPASLGAVAKAGDTMTGPLNVTGDGNKATTRGNLGVYTQLWSGAADVGTSIEAPGLRGFSILIIQTNHQQFAGVLRKVSDTRYTGGITASHDTWDFHRSAVVILTAASSTTDTWTILKCNYMNHTPSGNHTSMTNSQVTAIWGVV
ncbi:collagen-like protein [Eubacteriales bacterium OttesenSCG-928-A19]|nr:collagen-like protein [Eubacteriales bacterium OttesenSCG-928-A19]